MAERYKVQLGQVIARRRKDLGLTQKDVAERAHYKEAQSVSRWERGENLPSDLEVIASALDWTLGELVAGIEPPNRRVARQFGVLTNDEPAESPDLIATLSEPDVRVQLDRIEKSVDDLIERLVAAGVVAAVGKAPKKEPAKAPAARRPRAA